MDFKKIGGGKELIYIFAFVNFGTGKFLIL